MGILSFFLFVSISSNSYSWPTKEWSVELPTKFGANQAQLEKFLSYSFPEEMKGTDRSGVRTEGIVVIKDGILIFEKYASGYAADKRHLAWSITKMLTNALAGVAVRKGVWKTSDFVPESKALRIEHLLQWSSGLDWNETYEYNPLGSSVIAMLYGGAHFDAGRFVESHPFAATPGQRFNYSSGDSTLMMSALRRRMSDKDYENFPWKEIFEPLGMKSAVLERDAAGTFIGSSYLHASPRDLAKLGLLFLNDGVWGKKRILPEGWVYESSRIVPAFRQSARDRRRMSLSPAAHLWSNAADPSRGISKPLPDVPEDMIAAMGHWGQSISLLPTERMIVVRVADDRDHSFSLNKFLKLLLDSFGPEKNLERIVERPSP